LLHFFSKLKKMCHKQVGEKRKFKKAGNQTTSTGRLNGWWSGAAIYVEIAKRFGRPSRGLRQKGQTGPAGLKGK